MKQLIRHIFRALARRTLVKYRPVIVGIAGSVGKTGTKEAIAAALSAYPGGIRKTEGSFNAEVGVPVTIIAGGRARTSPAGWMSVIVRGLRQLMRTSAYPKLLVLELGADRPGDLRELLQVVQPSIGVLTSTAPEHMEFFGDIRSVISEESLIVRKLPATGAAIINIDDERNRQVVTELHGRVLTYGWHADATVRAEQLSLLFDDRHLPMGMVVKVAAAGSVIPVALPGVLGTHQVLPVLAALAAATALDVPLMDAVHGLSVYQPPAGRMRLLEGMNQTLIIDDSYNASPEAMTAALQTLFELHVPGRKIAVLGQMSELGASSNEWHETIGKMLLAKTVSHIITVGPLAEKIGQTAVKVGFPEARVRNVPHAEAAGSAVRDILAPGDVVLLKGSRYANRLERTARMILAHPERDGAKLVGGGD